ncbi:hypothetical protein [Flavobacterium terrigena]|nr:hypothetical protein [Flavobacterium terrigena]
MELINSIPSLCYMDDRIFHKVLSRKSTARQKFEAIKSGYSPESTPNYGLTLKQKGIWNTAFGLYKSKIKFLWQSQMLTEIEPN